MLEKAEASVLAAISAQAVWNAERRSGPSEALTRLIAECKETREDLIAASILALRNNSKRKRRLAAIRKGSSLAHVAASLGDLAVLLTDAKSSYRAINLDAKAEAAKAAKLGEQLRAALAQEEVAKSLSGSKEMRDRSFTLSKAAIKELREFALFAFRKDKTDTRRQLFSSGYLRKRNRRLRQQRRARQNNAPKASVSQ
jgi:hypothetical protein